MKAGAGGTGEAGHLKSYWRGYKQGCSEGKDEGRFEGLDEGYEKGSKRVLEYATALLRNQTESMEEPTSVGADGPSST